MTPFPTAAPADRMLHSSGRRRHAAAVGVALLALAAGAVRPARAAAPKDQLTPVLAAVLAPPRAVPLTDGRWQVPYELELTNVTDAPMTIESVEVRDPHRGGALVASLGAADIAKNLRIPGATGGATLDAAQGAVLFIDLSFAGAGEIPKGLEHWITVTTPNPKGTMPPRMVEEVARAAVGTAAPIVLAPPLRGGRWVAAASCCDSYHRHAILPVDGRRTVAQRFAIDWMQLADDGRPVDGDPAKNESYPQFGREVLAVANAKVVRVVDGLPEQKPGALPADTTISNADGNSVVLDLGSGNFALYAHMQPGSIRVHEGDRVRRGQVLGLLGNTGNSSAPHLHFHVMDGPSPLASNGLPYVIDRFEIRGEAVSQDELDSELTKTPSQPVEIRAVAGPARRTKQLPADLAVIEFAP